MSASRIIRLLMPTLLTVAAALGLIYESSVLNWLPNQEAADSSEKFVQIGLLILLGLTSAWLTCVLLDVFLWYMLVERRSGKHPPALLVAMVRVAVFLLIGMIIFRRIHQEPLDAVLLSSGVVGIVLGFALQRMISDFFSGIALNFEHPYREGDWIEVDGVAGKVVDVNWRATRLETLDHVTVIVPNSFISERRFLNYNLPLRHFRTEIEVSLEYQVLVKDAKRVLLAAIKAVPGVLAAPEPDVIIKEFGADGVNYRVRFFLNDYGQINIMRDAVATSVMQHLWQAGMSVPYPKRDVYLARMPERHISRATHKSALLKRVELFNMLTAEQINQLTGAVRERRFGAGVDVVQQGQAGASLFVVVEGLLDVKLSSDGQMRQVAQLVPGQFFGEMSLLSGDPRSATVTAVTETIVYEVTRDALAPLLQERPELAETLSRALAERRTRLDAHQRQTAAQTAQVPRSLADDLLRRIRGLFGLSK